MSVRTQASHETTAPDITAPGKESVGEWPDSHAVDARIGEIIADRYQLEERLPSSDVRPIYLARNLHIDRVVALKLIMPKSRTFDTAALARFSLEASALARTAHLNVVAVHDFGQTPQGELYIATGFVRGRTLERVIVEEGPLSFDRIVGIGVQVARGLRETHGSRLVHCDLKPSNIICAERADQGVDEVKVLGFHLQSLIEEEGAPILESHEHRSAIASSLPYVSPEQILGRQFDHRTDIYSLGIVLYEMVVGQAPFTGSNLAAIVRSHLEDAPASLDMLGYKRACPAPLEAIIRCCLEKPRSDRYATMTELLIDLKLVQSHIDAPPEAGDGPESTYAANPLRRMPGSSDKQWLDSPLPSRTKAILFFAFVILVNAAVALLLHAALDSK